MTDYFAVLGLSHCLLPDEALLKEVYFRKAAELHPDASQGDAEEFARIQEANRILGDHALRLRHLLALRFPEYSTGTITPTHPEIFMRVGQAIQDAKALLQREAMAGSPLARALLADERQKTLSDMRSAHEVVKEANAAFLQKLTEQNAKWPEVLPEDLASLAFEGMFLARWQSELAEWEFRLGPGN